MKQFGDSGVDDCFYFYFFELTFNVISTISSLNSDISRNTTTEKMVM